MGRDGIGVPRCGTTLPPRSSETRPDRCANAGARLIKLGAGGDRVAGITARVIRSSPPAAAQELESEAFDATDRWRSRTARFRPGDPVPALADPVPRRHDLRARLLD